MSDGKITIKSEYQRTLMRAAGELTLVKSFHYRG